MRDETNKTENNIQGSKNLTKKKKIRNLKAPSR